jgi:hypothetical protein
LAGSGLAASAPNGAEVSIAPQGAMEAPLVELLGLPLALLLLVLLPLLVLPAEAATGPAYLPKGSVHQAWAQLPPAPLAGYASAAAENGSAAAGYASAAAAVIPLVARAPPNGPAGLVCRRDWGLLNDPWWRGLRPMGPGFAKGPGPAAAPTHLALVR